MSARITALRLALLAILFACPGLSAGLVSAQEIAVAPRFDVAGSFHDGVAPVRVDGLWGLIDKHGKAVGEPAYDQIGPGGSGLFPYQHDRKWGFLDARGEKRIEAIYDDARPFDGGEAAVKSRGRWGLIRPDGTTKVEFRFAEIGGHGGGYISGLDDDGWALFEVDATGNVTRHALLASVYVEGGSKMTPPDRLYSISDGAVVAAYPDGERLVDLADPDLEDIQPIQSIRRRSEGFAAISYDGVTWGYSMLDSSLAFEDAMTFSEGMAPVKLDGKWGFIDRSGRFVIEPFYDAAYPIRDGYSVVRTGKKRGYLKNDLERGLISFIEPRYEDANRFSEGLAAVRIDGKWGYIRDSSGPVIMGEIVEVDAQ